MGLYWGQIAQLTVWESNVGPLAGSHPGWEETGLVVRSLRRKDSHGLMDMGSTPDLATLRADLNLN